MDPGLLVAEDLQGRAVFSKVGVKVRGFAGTGHALPADEYDRVFATSDIHSYYPKLVAMMRVLGLIALPAECGIEKDPYDTRLITDTEWIAERKTLFVICGDLVDGMRGGRVVTDPRGSFEFLMHCFLYNMRLKARQKGSGVYFTLGNHDVHSVVNFVRREGEGDDAYERRTPIDHATFMQYIDPAALQFFKRPTTTTALGAMRDRADALIPFYTCAPYVVLTLASEVMFVHGGLMHAQGGERSLELYRRALDTQLALDRARTPEDRLRVLHDRRYEVSLDVEGSTDRSVLWPRAYARSATRAVCADASTRRLAEEGFGLVVVGHCPTDSGEDALHPNWRAQCGDRTQHDSRVGKGAGCVLMHVCTGHETRGEKISVALVDTGISECMYASPDTDPLTRATDVLYLCKDGKFGNAKIEAFGTTRTYQYTRVRVGPDTAAAVPLSGRTSMVRRSLAHGGSYVPRRSEGRYTNPTPVAVTEAVRAERRIAFHNKRAKIAELGGNETHAQRHRAAALSVLLS